MRKCLTPEEITFKARGHELWSVGEEHVQECVDCTNKVAEARQEFMLQQAASPDQSPRPDKMGHTSRAYLQAITTT